MTLVSKRQRNLKCEFSTHEVIFGQLSFWCSDIDLLFFDAAYTKSLDLMGKLEHSDFDHCIKKLTLDSPLSKPLCF